MKESRFFNIGPLCFFFVVVVVHLFVCLFWRGGVGIDLKSFGFLRSKIREQKTYSREHNILISSHCLILSSHRHMEQSLNTVNIQGSSLCWGILTALFGELPWCWIPPGDVGWGCREETDDPGKNSVCVLWSLKQLHHLDAVGLCESGFGAHVWAHVVWFWNSVCVFLLRRCFPLTEHKSTGNFLNTSHHHHTLDIHYLILSSTQSFLKFG